MPQTGVKIAPSSSPVEQVLSNIVGESEEGIGYEEPTKNQIYIPEKKGWRKVAAFIGPGFLICIAYIDPGNFQSDLRAGASYRFELLWVILLSSCSALIIQSLSAKLGVVTKKHLAEHCRDEYSKTITIILWLLAEVAIVASDIPEVIGTAFALNILFDVPIWGGVLVTGCSTFLLLALQQYGVRKLEFIIGLFVAIMAICFFIELAIVKPDGIGVLRGLFVPSLQGPGATGIAISLLGAMIMPHNLFLHSALVLTRKVPQTTNAIKDACWYNTIESGCALFLAFLINVSIISVSGSMCNDREISIQNKANCADLDLNKASFLLQNVLGKWSKVVFGIALLASGQSSTITGTFAGQYVMQGFLNLRFKAWITNLITRSVAILPSLIAALIGGSSGAGQLIIISSMILAFQLPFTLVPLLKFTSSNVKMGPHVNSKLVMFSTWIIGCAILGINIYFLTTAFAKWIIHGSLNKGSKIAMGIFGFTGITIYLIAIICLAFRTGRRDEETHMVSLEDGLNRQFDEVQVTDTSM